MSNSNLVSTAIATGGTSFDTATCIGGYKNDPFAVFNASGVIYYHDMLQTRSEYQTPSLNKTMVTYDASTAPDGVKPTRSPFADDANAYFVGDDNFQDAGQGLVRFRRAFSRVPSNYKEPYGLYNRILPSITATNFYAYYDFDRYDGGWQSDMNDSASSNPLLADNCTLSYYFGTRAELETAGDDFTGMTPHKSWSGSDSQDDTGGQIFGRVGATWTGDAQGDGSYSEDTTWEDLSSVSRSTIDNYHYRVKFEGKLDISTSNNSAPHEWVDSTGVFVDEGFRCILIMAQNYYRWGSLQVTQFNTNNDTFGNSVTNNNQGTGLVVLLKRRNRDDRIKIYKTKEWNHLVVTSIDRSTGEFTAISDIRTDLVDLFNEGLATGYNTVEKFAIAMGIGKFEYWSSAVSNQNVINRFSNSKFGIGGIAFSTGQNRTFASHKNLPAQISYRFVRSDQLDNVNLAGVFEYPQAITENTNPNNQEWVGISSSGFYSVENEFIERYLGNIYRIGQIETRLE